MSDAIHQPSPAPPPQELTPEIVALLRRHALLQPLIQGLVEEKLVACVPLESTRRQLLVEDWAGQLGVERAFEQTRHRLGLLPADITWQVERSERLARVAADRFAAKAEARFLHRKAELDLVTYSLVRVKDANLARELYLRLSDQEASFADLAARYSDGPERQTQGVIGPRPISQAHPLLAERLRTARDGEVMAPLHVADWWLIVRRDAYQSAVLDETMLSRMTQELLEEWIAEEVQRHLLPLNAESPAAPNPISESLTAAARSLHDL